MSDDLATVSERILRDVSASIVAARRHMEFAEVQRLNDAGGIVSRYPTAQIWVSGDSTVGTDLFGSIDVDVRSMRLVVRCWVSDMYDLPRRLTDADASVTLALYEDTTRGDLARHTQRTGSVHFAPDDGTGIGYVDVAFDVSYACERLDPTMRV